MKKQDLICIMAAIITAPDVSVEPVESVKRALDIVREVDRRAPVPVCDYGECLNDAVADGMCEWHQAEREVA
jgi:hypothetical protein